MRLIRSIRSLLLLCVFSLFIGISFAAFSADTFITQFDLQKAKLSAVQQKTYYTAVLKRLGSLTLTYRQDPVQLKAINAVRTYIRSQFTTFTGSSMIPSFVVSGMTIPKVDIVKVRKVRLDLHNTERATKKLTPFVYSSVLEGTATTWANHLADEKKTTGLHKRKSTDSTYSYDSIKQRFLDQGIIFATKEKNGQSLFTENLGRGYYTCKKTDCTNDFIKAIKTTRAFFMSKKGKKYKPHYNAIVGNYQNIGLGVGLVGGTYYLVTHYTQGLK